MSPPLICVEIYISKSNLTCSFNSLDSVQLGYCPLVLVDLNRGSLLFVIASCSPFVFLKIIFSFISWCWDIPKSSIVFIILITSVPIASLLPSWISSAASSGRNGLPSSLNSVVRSERCLLNLASKLSESSWWWKMVWSLVCKTVPFQIRQLLSIFLGYRLSTPSTYPHPLLEQPVHFRHLHICCSCCSWRWSNFIEEKASLVLNTTKFLFQTHDR